MIDIYEESVVEMSKKIKSKTVKSVSIEEGLCDFLVFVFDDGTILKIQYDYLYGYEIKEP
jgi:hypothetical protein